MKKILSFTLAGVLLLGLLVGCNNGKSAPDDGDGNTYTDTEFTELAMATGGTSGTYNGVSADVQTVAVMATIVARYDVPREIVYAFTKCLFEYKAEITAGHAKGELLDPSTGISGVSIPLHHGAAQYYSEVGMK